MRPTIPNENQVENASFRDQFRQWLADQPKNYTNEVDKLIGNLESADVGAAEGWNFPMPGGEDPGAQ